MFTSHLLNSALVTAVVFSLVACAKEQSGRGSIAADSLVVGYWDTPLKIQGEAPDGWSDLERSLSPDDCGQCHPQQFGDWKTTVHSRAFSPGFVGQLVGIEFADAAACMECHAPLDEQRRDFELARMRNEGHLRDSQGLAASGNGCAGCHLRNRIVFGPSHRVSGATGQSPNRRPHGGVYRTPFFESSDFCRGCHQFPQSMAVNGKPLENTYEEWRRSPYAAQGVTCQTCHMPDRRHLWRGIHDPEMVAGGLTPHFSTDAAGARFALTSAWVGHAFPTYVTPKVILRAVALDVLGEPVRGSEVSYVIQRRVESVDGEWIEHSDTRLFPGETVSLDIGWGEVDRVRMWLEVRPDDFYDRDVYDVLLDRLGPDDPAAGLIAEADRLAVSSSFRLFETDLARPGSELDRERTH